MSDDLNSMLDKLNKMSNPRDNAFQTMSDNIWKKDMLRQMNRFNEMQITEMIKNLILILLYEKKYNEIKVKHKIKKIKQYPYHEITTTTTYEKTDISEYYKTSPHMEILVAITEYFIGCKGQARTEVFNFIGALDRQIAEEIHKQNGLKPTL